MTDNIKKIKVRQYCVQEVELEMPKSAPSPKQKGLRILKKAQEHKNTPTPKDENNSSTSTDSNPNSNNDNVKEKYIVDARFEGGNTNNGGERFDIIPTPADKIVDVLLSIDLGNTRTFAILVDDINNAEFGMLNFYRFPIKGCATKISLKACTESFDSSISLCNREDDPKSEGHRSFIQVGDFANLNNAYCGREKTPGRYNLSSPKRYYSDDDPAEEEWGFYSLKNKLENSQPFFYKLLMSGNSNKPVPRSTMLSAMVLEIYEQASIYVNSKEFENSVKNKKGQERRIRQIHITYPSTFSPEELTKYKKKLAVGLEQYSKKLYKGETFGKIEVHSNIDEATAVLAMYLYSEISKFRNDPLLWLHYMGKASGASYIARIATIDIGGGTSDLSIADVISKKDDTLYSENKVEIQHLYQDGVTTAGDQLIKEIMEKITLPKLTQAFSNKNGSDIDLFTPDFTKYYNVCVDKDNKYNAIKLNVLKLITIQIATKLDSVAIKNPSNFTGKVVFNDDIDTTSFNDFWGIFNNYCKKNDDDKSNDDKSNMKTPTGINLDANDIKIYKKIVKDCFNNTLKSFAKTIGAFNCDLVLIAGKTSEFKAVIELINDYVCIPSQLKIQMSKYKLSESLRSASESDELNDPKIATAIGGALQCLGTLQKNVSAIDISYKGIISSALYYWGIATSLTDLKLPKENAILTNDNREAPILFRGKPIYIMRRNQTANNVVLSYELRIKPSIAKEEKIDTPIKITLLYPPNEIKLEIKSVEGKYESQKEALPEHFELKIRNYGPESFFWDDNHIPEIHKPIPVKREENKNEGNK